MRGGSGVGDECMLDAVVSVNASGTGWLAGCYDATLLMMFMNWLFIMRYTICFIRYKTHRGSCYDLPPSFDNHSSTHPSSLAPLPELLPGLAWPSNGASRP
jgi:hypothetical protein